MCIIVVKPKGKKLPCKNTLKTCFENNPHGAGYVFSRNGKLHLRKGFLTFETFWKSISAEKICRTDDAVLHFRQATSGLVDAGNTHPFPLTKDIRKLRATLLDTRLPAVAHNGVLTGLGDDKKLSDTQVFVRDYLSDRDISRGLFRSSAIQSLISEYITSDKLAFLSATKGILLIGNFTQNKGCLYSNDGYKKVTLKYTRRGYYGTDELAELAEYDDRVYRNLQAKSKKTTAEKSWFTCEMCGNERKVKYVKKWDANLCKKCRRNAERYGFADKWTGFHEV
jgi:predicted glutamine amidotransferase